MRVYKLQTRTETIQSSIMSIYFSVHMLCLFTIKFEKKTRLSLQKNILLERKKLFNKILFFDFYVSLLMVPQNFIFIFF